MTQAQNITIEEAFRIATNLHSQNRLEEAKALYIQLINAQPNNANFYNRLGAVFDAQGHLQDAINLYKKSVSANPQLCAAHYNLANAYRDNSEFDKAIPHYREALRINPQHADALASFHHTLQHVCAWDEYNSLTQQLDKAQQFALAKGGRTPETPFVHITRCDDQSTNLAVANSWANYIKQGIAHVDVKFPKQARNKADNKITIGYLSRDLRDRPTGHLTLRIFDLHNKDKFRIIAYSYGPDDGSNYRQKIKQGCDKFVDIDKMNFVEAAKTIYQDQVDILVDMQGYMADNRLEIAALRPAPVQISYLGFPGTIGGGIFDYTLTDEICVPKEEAKNFDEKLLYVPNCYQANNNEQPIADEKYSRQDFGLPENGVVFCSFNWSHKLDPVMFASWMNILQRVPDSVLWLWESSELTTKNLKAAAKKHGIAPERLVFSGKLPKDKHLARLRQADLMLDTRIYGGHTTTSDALWAGVPAITLLGKHFASRVCASLLTNVGLPELVANDTESYEDLAVDIASNPNKLKSLKRKLSENIGTTPLFDTPGFVKDLEEVYESVRV